MIKFNPLEATREELDAMTRGYVHAISGRTLPQESSPAYRHGWRVGRNDKKGRVEQFQLDLLRDIKAKMEHP